MSQSEVTISNALGLHARAAAKFVHAASRYRAEVRVSREGRTVDGKSIMGMLLLAARRGTTITIATSGVDADAALAALITLVHSGFGEDSWSA